MKHTIFSPNCWFKGISFFSLQGSYGVVKLAYNEDSEQYYVSLECKQFEPNCSLMENNH